MIEPTLQGHPVTIGNGLLVFVCVCVLNIFVSSRNFASSVAVCLKPTLIRDIDLVNIDKVLYPFLSDCRGEVCK